MLLSNSLKSSSSTIPYVLCRVGIFGVESFDTRSTNIFVIVDVIVDVVVVVSDIEGFKALVCLCKFMRRECCGLRVPVVRLIESC